MTHFSNPPHIIINNIKEYMENVPTYELCPCGQILWTYDMRLDHDRHIIFAHANPECKNPYLCKPHGEIGKVSYKKPIDSAFKA
jgi:hypothetical protein